MKKEKPALCPKCKSKLGRDELEGYGYCFTHGTVQLAPTPDIEYIKETRGRKNNVEKGAEVWLR